VEKIDPEPLAGELGAGDGNASGLSSPKNTIVIYEAPDLSCRLIGRHVFGDESILHYFDRGVSHVVLFRGDREVFVKAGETVQ
jgi:hypothetical protein